MNPHKNKILGKGKTKMVEPNNKRDKTSNKTIPNLDKASSKPEVSSRKQALA